MVIEKFLDLQKKIKIKFNKVSLLKQSLIHKSYDSKNNNEKLEFLGDRVLGLAISSIIYKKFNKNNEGDLSKKLSYLVQKNFLYKISTNLEIDRFLKFSSKKNNKMNISILSDSIESLIGALYLDGGFMSAKKFI